MKQSINRFTELKNFNINLSFQKVKDKKESLDCQNGLKNDFH